MSILLETPTYKSIENADGSVTIRTTENGGCTFQVATIHRDGRVEGDDDDIVGIVTGLRGLDEEGVEDDEEIDPRLVLIEQAGLDRFFARLLDLARDF